MSQALPASPRHASLIDLLLSAASMSAWLTPLPLNFCIYRICLCLSVLKFMYLSLLSDLRSSRAVSVSFFILVFAALILCLVPVFQVHDGDSISLAWLWSRVLFGKY